MSRFIKRITRKVKLSQTQVSKINVSFHMITGSAEKFFSHQRTRGMDFMRFCEKKEQYTFHVFLFTIKHIKVSEGLCTVS